ncbi:TIGR02391 family protein [Microbacterium aureliae]
MSTLDIAWAIQELEAFVHAAGTGGMYQREEDEIVAERAHVVEQILDRVLPGWRARADQRSPKLREFEPWGHLRDCASRGIAALKRQDELSERLGDSAPTISAAQLHPWVWSGARSLWQSGHYRSAVEDAAKKVNAATQNKVGRRDVSETDLFKQAFSIYAAVSGKERLRRRPPDGSDTYRSLQRGAMALAEGIYAGIRNPFNHQDPKDIDEQTALEYLAALSVLARWVDDAQVEKGS